MINEIKNKILNLLLKNNKNYNFYEENIEDKELEQFNYNDITIKTFFYNEKNEYKFQTFENINFCYVKFNSLKDKINICLFFKEKIIFNSNKINLINGFRQALIESFENNLLKMNISDINVLINKYINHFQKIILNIYFYKLEKEIKNKSKFKNNITNIIFGDNKFEIHFKNLKTKMFLYNDLKLYELPKNLSLLINSIVLTVNNDLSIIDTHVFLNKQEHPNVNKYKNYCMGNYRYNKINIETIDNLIKNIQIYNLINSYGISKNLKKYIKSNIHPEKSDIFFS